MAYHEFVSELIKKLEDRQHELGFDNLKFLQDGTTSTDEKNLSLIRETNIKYNKTESDVLIGDFILLYLHKNEREQSCRYSLSLLYERYTDGGWDPVWKQVRSSLELCKNLMQNGIMSLIEKNDYDLIKDKLIIRPLNYDSHKYELKNHIYRRVGDMVLVLYLLADDGKSGKTDNIVSFKLPRVTFEAWGLDEDEVWDGALSNTYVLAPPRMYFNPMDLVKPPYHKGAFMALNSDITSIPPHSVPTITTTTQINGAIAMFYPGVMQRIAELIGGDYYIAFTSINDVRLHKTGTISPWSILRNLKEVNKVFDPTETLSNKVYLYETSTQKMRQLEL